MNCPRCAVPLRSVSLRDIEIDTCDRCHGLWFEEDELKRAVETTGDKLAETSALSDSWNAEVTRAEAPGQGELACPKCGKTMPRYRYAVTTDVILDGCPAGCGVWVDEGELRKIFNFMVESRKPLDPKQYEEIQKKLDAIKKEAKEKEEALIDSLVQMDDKPGLWRYPGEILQFIYRIFYKVGL